MLVWLKSYFNDCLGLSADLGDLAASVFRETSTTFEDGPEPTLKLSTGAAARPVEAVIQFEPFPVVIRGYGRIKSNCSLLLKKYRGRPIKDVISCVEVLKSFNDFATELVTKCHNALLPRFADFS